MTTSACATGRSPWLHDPRVEGPFVLGPPLLATAVAVVWASLDPDNLVVTPILWLLLVVGIDVAHVYSTLYRTYLRDRERRANRRLLLAIPLLGWVAGSVVHSMSAAAFWRTLAYVAVFHFVRQQYGFFRLYYRHDAETPRQRRVRAIAIYLATLWPLVYWHTHPRDFAWFMAGDFVMLDAPWLSDAVLVVYLAALAGHAWQEWGKWRRERTFNVPANLVLAGTALSWWLGIVVFDGDLVFTITNVVAHGIPYIALVWIDHRKSSAEGPLLRVTRKSVAMFVALLVALAFVEEALWDRLAWQKYDEFFGWLAFIPRLVRAEEKAWIVPLLAVPQLTHYVLDGFIWKVRGERAAWLTAYR